MLVVSFYILIEKKTYQSIKITNESFLNIYRLYKKEQIYIKWPQESKNALIQKKTYKKKLQNDKKRAELTCKYLCVYLFYSAKKQQLI